MDMAKVNEMLTFYVRPQTFPFAVRFCQSMDEVPAKARIPQRDFNMQIPICQAVGMVRRYGWTIALTKDDEACPYGALALGFVEPKESYLDGSYSEAVSPGTGAIVANSAPGMPRLAYGKYAAMVLAPLHSVTFEPDLVITYGNAAQVMRMVQGALHGRGGVIRSRASGAWDCADMFAQPMESGEAHLVLPCNGDRVFGAAQDDEMAFTMPGALVESTLEGLKVEHESGARRYPIPSFLRFQAQLPPAYYKLMDYLKET